MEWSNRLWFHFWCCPSICLGGRAQWTTRFPARTAGLRSVVWAVDPQNTKQQCYLLLFCVNFIHVAQRGKHNQHNPPQQPSQPSESLVQLKKKPQRFETRLTSSYYRTSRMKENRALKRLRPWRNWGRTL